MGQLDLRVSDARRTMVKKMLTTRMANRLKDEEVNRKKVRRRDRSNNLLADNIDTLIKEEGKLNLHLKQVPKMILLIAANHTQHVFEDKLPPGT